MKYCYHCGHLTAGEPLFCNFCGRSYDLKLCPRRHPNPRFADVCSQCGSRELSTPQPKVSFWWKVLAFLLQVFLGIVLGLTSLAVVTELLRTPAMQDLLILEGFVLLILWVIWAMLLDWFRKFIHWLTKKRGRRGER